MKDLKKLSWQELQHDRQQTIELIIEVNRIEGSTLMSLEARGLHYMIGQFWVMSLQNERKKHERELFCLRREIRRRRRLVGSLC